MAVNPLDPYNMVGSSKKFTDPHTYAFSLATYYTFDGGQSWNESSPLKLLNTGDVDAAGVAWTGDPWAGLSDPAVAWDDVGNVFLVGLMFGVPTQTDPYHFLGMAVYKSTDGGRTWSPPRVIHKGLDDKQWAAGDLNPASPYHGYIYAVWDDLAVGQLAFARTTDHGMSWIGVGAQPAGSPLTNQMIFGEVNVASDGTVYIFGLDPAETAIWFMKSTDGGQTFSAPSLVASPISPVLSPLPGGKFRLETMPTGCCGTGNRIFCAWPDHREGVTRIYYNRSNNGGNSWQGSGSGDPLLTGAVASAGDQHDFMPQIVSTPTGEIGCAFYEFGPKGGQTPLIDVVLAVSTDNGHTFPNRVTVTDQPWDPTVDEVWAHGDPNITFIGDYFGLDASRLGFFPFWTDTRTNVQEMFTARVSVNPADIYIRDSSSDTGTVPSPGYHWEAPDLIVRWQQDGNATFVDQGIQSPVLNDHYIYGRVTNNGPNTARNVTLAVTVGNWPQLVSLPATEFRYPLDWYQGDWIIPSDPMKTAQLQANRLALGESAPIATIANGATQIIGPVVWPAGQIPAQGTWHPCLLAEVRADNNDSAGGVNGCDIDADPDPCLYGSYFWGNNNACQRNLTYHPAPAGARALIRLPFVIGSVWSRARFVEVLVDKGPELAETPMTLHMEPISLPGQPPKPVCHPGEIVFTDRCRVLVRADNCDVGELITSPGTAWRPHCPLPTTPLLTETCHGAEKVGQEWKLVRPKCGVGFPVEAGELRKMTLSFFTPATLKPGTRPLVRIFQRNDKHVITGSVILELQIREKVEKPSRPAPAERLAATRVPKDTREPRKARRGRR